ncbi:MAG: discoidin domain-containing protein [Cellulosilyticaceae bacterium]
MNKYVFKVYDQNGKLKQKETSENVVLTQFCTGLSLQTVQYEYGDYYLQIQLGKGTGTPAASDTTLFTAGIEMRQPTTQTPTYTDSSHTTSKIVYTFPATSSYVGTFTEFGLAIASTLITHGLITDAAGNPISIVKTDTDILVVEVYLYISYAGGANLPSGFVPRINRFPHKRGNLIGDAGNYGPMYDQAAYNYFLFGVISVPALIQSVYPYRYTQLIGGTNNIGNVDLAVDGSSFKGSYSGTARLDASANNGRYFKTFELRNTGSIPLPNANILPTYTIAGKAVGAGDGVKTAFTCPFAYFKKDTDKLYVDGVLKTRGTDYTIDSDNHIGEDPCFSAMNNPLATVSAINMRNSYAMWPFVMAPGTCDGSSGYYSISYASVMGPVAKYGQPIVCDFGSVQNINTVKFPKNNVTINKAMQFSYSTDGTNYTVFQTATYYGNELAQQTKTYTLFQARYIKIEYMTNDTGEWAAYADEYSSTLDGVATIASDGPGWIGYIGTGIVFTTPPANGAVITMDVDMDILYKSADVVVDITSVSYKLTCTGGA